jgi:opacity protein-like surface antigen
MKWMNGCRPLLLSYTFLCVCSAAFAAAPSPKGISKIPTHTPGHFEVIGAGSLSNVNASNGTLTVTSSERDKLNQTNDNAWTSWGGQLGAGYVYFIGHAVEFSNTVQWFPTIEPELNVYFNKYNNAGQVWRFGSPAFNQLTYNMPIYSTRLMLDGALTVISKSESSAYVIGGIGNSWNRAKYSDKDNSGDVCNTASIGLNGHSRSHFVWEVGAGVAYVINNRTNLFLEYLYTDYGRLTASGGGSTGAITAPMTTANFNLQTQAVLLGVHMSV